jgi:ubiquinone/menaquinone biosynthesis C-methylase UbiE
MSTISTYNSTLKFEYELRESRLKKCQRMMESLPPGHMLDIGCSTGDWALYWQSRRWQCSGIDIDREHLAIALDRGVEARFCDLNRDSLPFTDATFDLIFAGEVIEHLVDTDFFLTELHRCLRPGGVVLITTPNLVSFENRLRILLGIYPIWVNYNLSGSGHIRAYTPRVLRKQLEDHGFRIRRHTGNWVPFVPQHFVSDIDIPALSITGDLFPTLAMDTIMMAEKQCAEIRNK